MPKAGTLTKAKIIDAVTERIGYTRKKSIETVEIMLEIIKSTLESGDDILISGFGKFCVKNKAERKGRNPSTGEDMMLRPRKVVTFQCSGNLRDKIMSAPVGKKVSKLKRRGSK